MLAAYLKDKEDIEGKIKENPDPEDAKERHSKVMGSSRARAL